MVCPKYSRFFKMFTMVDEYSRNDRTEFIHTVQETQVAQQSAAAIGTIEQDCEGSRFAPAVWITPYIAADFLLPSQDCSIVPIAAARCMSTAPTMASGFLNIPVPIIPKFRVGHYALHNTVLMRVLS